MKNIHLFAIMLLFFAISCKEETQIQQPDIKVMNGSGVLYGNALIYPRMGGDIRDYDHSGILVEVVGTNISVLTTNNSRATNGNFVIRELDSGVYTIRFSKIGYETVTIPNINHNGRDSSEIIWSVSDSNGETKYSIAELYELPPVISLTSYNATLVESIKNDTIRNHNTIRINRDTAYNANINFSFNAESPLEWSQSNFPIGYIAYLSKSAIPSNDLKPANDYPDGDYYLSEYIRNKQLPGGRLQIDITPKDAPFKIEYSTSSLLTITKHINVSLQMREKLYIHIYPIASRTYSSIQSSKYDPPYLGIKQKWVVQDPITIPIEWK